MDEDRLRSERADRRLWKSRVHGLDEEYPHHGFDAEPPRRERMRRPSDDDDAEYRLAIEASKHEAEEEERRRGKAAKSQEEDADLARAIKLSKEEEDLRKRELEESNAQSLFDDTPVQPAQAQATGYNQGYQQQPAVDWFGNPINPQQPMTTGFLNNQYAQPTGLTAQPTGMVNGYANGFQTQPTGFDQYGQLQNGSSSFLQPQQTAFNTNNPYGTADLYTQPQPQQQPLQESFPSGGSNNPWSTSHQQQQQAEALKPLPTGSNNPFASRSTQQQPFQATNRLFTPSSQPSLGTLAEERATTQFSRPNPIANFHPAPSKSTPPENPHYARLNALLASGEGLDTFGNTGDLRIPAQHTAPGVFVNSAGQGIDRLRAAQTGNNPFLGGGFTGLHSQPTGGFAQQPSSSSSNPWASTQPSRSQQAGSLIDL